MKRLAWIAVAVAAIGVSAVVATLVLVDREGAVPARPSSSAATMADDPRSAAGATTTLEARHFVFDVDTLVEHRFVLRPGDTVELRNGACLCFGPGGSADWQGTPTSTWSDDGTTRYLERDVEITGHGHIRFMAGSGISNIRFVEIDLQPDQELGEYPLHWHHAGDGVRGTLVEGVVVRNSTNRAFVPHASHGITFRDTIAYNIIGDAYWWDPPPEEGDTSNNSNDVLFDHALAAEIHRMPGDNGRFGGFFLGAGTGNAVVNSAALNVTGDKNAGGFVWPEISSQGQPLTWRFENNVAHNNETNGIFVWQNNSQEHVIDGFRAWDNERSDIEHGAYANDYDYRNIETDSVILHALGWSVTGGHIGTITALGHSLPADAKGPATFTDVTIGRLVIDNAAGNHPGAYVFTNTNLSFPNVTVVSAFPGTTVTIDGQTRSFG